VKTPSQHFAAGHHLPRGEIAANILRTISASLIAEPFAPLNNVMIIRHDTFPDPVEAVLERRRTAFGAINFELPDGLAGTQ
jgi:hypothetical protein